MTKEVKLAESTVEKVRARDLILKAAAQVFSEQGIKGATTREIARIAGVNESTLFRNFESKEILLKAVIEQVTGGMVQNLTDPATWTGDLYTDLLHFANVDYQTLVKNEALVRTFLGEVYRQPESARQVLQSASKPFRELMMNYLTEQQAAGKIRAELNLNVVLDGFAGMMMSGMLKRGCFELPYNEQEYIETCVEMVFQGIKTPD